jgi:4a-hydroxytetrahydrobiopterin dehydratase
MENTQEWLETNGALTKTFVFADFDEAWRFMEKVSVVVKQADHHPKWTNIYNKVSFELSTHDAGDLVTEKDRDLAEKIDSLC